MNPCVEKVLELVAIPLTHPEVHLHTGVQPPRGVLLHGPSVCDKTLLANAIGGVRIPTFLLAKSFMDSRIGLTIHFDFGPVDRVGLCRATEMKLHESFEEAKRVALRLLFIDEIDTITPKRETTQSKMERRIVAQLLACMDGKLPLKVVIQMPNIMCVCILPPRHVKTLSRSAAIS
ncbi:P-loop containing nucleoside triphosphate hydrolase protein [Lactarius hatsudake]|nr:P-loop containing nucleoside triphosphate hydrolase protein [Lactarius hatsudake]